MDCTKHSWSGNPYEGFTCGNCPKTATYHEIKRELIHLSLTSFNYLPYDEYVAERKGNWVEECDPD